MTNRLKSGYEMSHPEPGDEVLISGISGYFPESGSVLELQENLFKKVNLVTKDDRRWKPLYTDIPHEMGKISKLDKFDASFFGVDFKLAHNVDPMSRLLLERSYEAIIDAGMNPAEFQNTKTGVFAGCCFYESENKLLYEKVHCNEHGLIGCSQSSLACRIAQWLGVTGPAFTIDTACSSSTYALDRAFKAIRSGECDSAIVCGVNVAVNPYISTVFTRMGILAPDGKSKSFDASANGYARSEAVVVCLLQKAKLSRRAYAEVVYSKTNCDGFKEKGITYPSGNIQRCLLKDFYEECHIQANTVEYIEAHGTGTTVGDIEELNAIDAVMCNDRAGPLLIGSMKSNMGHAEGASGLCSTTKLCIAYHSGYIPPNIHYNEPRKEIPALIEGRLKVITEKQAWNRGLASFSGFGFGGANAHVLLKNFNKKKVNNGKPKDNLPRLVCVSGRTKSSVELILNSLGERSMDAEEIRLWHAIHEKNIEGHKFRGFVVLKSTPAKTVTIARDVLRHRKTDRPIFCVYPDVNSQIVNVKLLMDLPIFASAIHKCDAALRTKGVNVNLLEIITATSSKSFNNLHFCITTVALQIGLTDVVRNVGVVPDSIVGYGIGELGSAYANGIINVEQAMERAYEYGNGNVKDITAKSTPESRNINGHKEGMEGRKECKDNKTQIKSNQSIEYSDAKYIIPLIPSNAILVPVSPDPKCKSALVGNVKNNIEVNLVEDKTDNALKDLLTGLGRLYEAGLNLKIEKLYPHVSFPVSQSTPMLSHLVEWNHREKWFRDSFFESRPKLTASERIVQISMDDPDYNYLLGHCIGGRHLYPGAGYLLLSWETLAMMHGRDYRDFSVTFENIQFLRATTLPKKGILEFNISIHPVSGEFEITENKAAIVTGIIYPKKNVGETVQKLPSIEPNNDPEKLKLTEKDFYRELKLRGYDYSGLFKGVVESSIDGYHSRVIWNNNWTVYIDYVFQVIGFIRDTRNLYVPTNCAKLSIDMDLHYSTLAKTKNGANHLVDVFIDKDTYVTRSAGLEVRGFNATMVSKKTDLSMPIYENYKFVPNYGKDLEALEEIIRIYVDIIIENTQVYKFKAVEIINEANENKSFCRPVLEYVDKALENVPQTWAELNIVSNDKNNVEGIPNITKLTKIPGDKSAVLFVCENLSQNFSIIKESESCLRTGGFLLSIEEDVTSIKKVNDEFDVVALRSTDNKTFVLLKKKIKIESKVLINIKTLDHSFAWISKLKEAMEERKKIVLYANDDISGVLGLVNCLRREPGGEMIQCLFVPDQIKASNDTLQIYRRQLDKNLAFNVLHGGQWGTYRHSALKKIDVIKPLPYAYVDVETIGDLSSIKWLEGGLEENIKSKNDNQLFVHVYCSALNFRDIVTATGRVAVDAVARGRLAQECVQGFEFAGKLANGMRVAGIAERSISNMLLCSKNLILFIPDEWTFEEAASVMAAYSTVYLAFDVLGKIKPGESILIHAGSGAVGQAAINVALHRGCKVFTTVGTPDKVAFIKKLFPELKDKNIGNSRDTSFEQLVMKETNGQGVDLVLNSLSEDKLLASVRCLGFRGRFLEIGKYDIFKNTKLEMLLHQNEVSFHGVMLDYVFDNSIDGRRVVEFVTKGILNGEVRPITNCTFEKRDVEAAYRYMAGGKHIGKVIIKIRDEEDGKLTKPKPILIDAHRRYTCHKSFVYILVGGLGGFGLELADWLVLRGARKLVLVSSRGISTGYQARRVKTWTSYGSEIRILTDDVTTEFGCKKVLESALEMGHVQAIFNLAGILNDALFPHQSAEMFLQTFKPKALTTLYLDKLSRNMCPGLKDFVIFSSLACGRGNSGQSNYGLANSVMERICEKRKKDGLPGLAIQWGCIGDVGMLADLQAETGESDVAGVLPQRISSCLRSLDVLLLQEDAIVSTYVLAQKTVTENDKKTAVQTVAQIIGLKNLKTVSYQASLAELGMDSMMALEVKQSLERDFDIVLTAQDLRSMTLAKLTSVATELDTSSNETSVIGQTKPTVQDDFVFDLRYFLRNFGEEENALKPYIIMPTSFTSNDHVDNLATKTLFMLPGLEGCASSLEPLCRRLHAEACVLQLPFVNIPRDLQDLTDRLYKVLKSLKTHTSSFNLLGYSYGTIPLLSLAAKLESEGLTGTVFCIDGSPAWIATLFKNRLGSSDDEKLQDDIIKYVFEATLHNDATVASLVEKTRELSDNDDKIDYVIAHSPIDLKYSNEFFKNICKASNSRLKIVKDYNFNAINKIKSPIVLLRPEYGIIDKFAENYELDSFTEGGVTVEYLKGNHVSILEDPNCALIIEKYMMSSS